MPLAGFKTAILASEKNQTDALNRAATGVDKRRVMANNDGERKNT